MRKLFLLIGCLLFFPFCVVNADSVRIYKETNGIPHEKSESGTIRQVSPDEIILEQRDQVSLTIPIHQVLWAGFGDEPIHLTKARTLVLIGKYDSAIEEINKIPEKELKNASSLILQEIEYYRAYSEAQKALLRDYDESSLYAAGKLLNTFLRNNPDSFHYYEANEIVGTLLLYLNKSDLAKSYFEKIAKASSPETRFPAVIQLANILIDKKDDQENNRETVRALLNEILQFQEAEALLENSSTEESKSVSTWQTLRFQAKIALARLDGLDGNVEQAIQNLKEMSQSADSFKTPVQAALFNALGELYQLSGNDREAVLAYLHVDLLFFLSGLEERKALQQLYELWKKQGKEDRVSDVKKRIKEKFGIVFE